MSVCDEGWECPCLDEVHGAYCALMDGDAHPTTCIHAAALRKVADNPTYALLAVPEVVARRISGGDKANVGKEV